LSCDISSGAPALIEHKNLKFLIINNPTPATLPKFINELEKSNVKVVVRCCEPSYSSEPLEEKGIKVVDLQFDDGGAPSEDITKEWLKLVKETFDSDPSCFIAVHCVAGLGRAPVLVAIALIEKGLKYHQAVDLIRSKRRGAINKRQLDFLENYKSEKCSIM
jgi:protein tyrosine phosphatase type 4A